MKTPLSYRPLLSALAVPVVAVALVCSFTARSVLAASYLIDDGTNEGSIGLAGAGDFVALNSFATVPGNNLISLISISFSSSGGTPGPLNGLPFQAILWSDPNGDGSPVDAVVLAVANGVVAAAGTNTFINVPIAPTLVTTANFFVGFLISQPAGSLPGAVDRTPPTFANRSFLDAAPTGTYDINDLSGAIAIETIGPAFAGNWLIRAEGNLVANGVPETGTSALLLALALLGLIASERLMARRFDRAR